MSKINLFNNNQNNYGPDYNSHILEQWKTCIDMADKNSERRVTTNNIFITLNSAIVAIATLIPKEQEIAISIVGLVVSILWIITLKNYKKLNSAKFAIINELEKKLPSQPYNYEWFIVGQGKNKKKYKTFTELEVLIPYIFILIYLGILILNILK